MPDHPDGILMNVEWTDADGQRVVIRDGRLSIYGEPSMRRSDGQVAIGADIPAHVSEARLRRKVDEATKRADEASGELDAVVMAVKAVIENCKHSPVDAIRHQLVGLLPEVQDMGPEQKQRLRDAGMGHLVARHEELVRENWRRYGYGE